MKQYTHDCDQCVFLGTHEHYDLYWCPQPSIGPTLVARYGHHGPEYTSFPAILCERDLPAMLEAARELARQHGYLTLA